jgi:hypothetical protein
VGLDIVFCVWWEKGGGGEGVSCKDLEETSFARRWRKRGKIGFIIPKP